MVRTLLCIRQIPRWQSGQNSDHKHITPDVDSRLVSTSNVVFPDTYQRPGRLFHNQFGSHITAEQMLTITLNIDKPKQNYYVQ